MAISLSFDRPGTDGITTRFQARTLRCSPSQISSLSDELALTRELARNGPDGPDGSGVTGVARVVWAGRAGGGWGGWSGGTRFGRCASVPKSFTIVTPTNCAANPACPIENCRSRTTPHIAHDGFPSRSGGWYSGGREIRVWAHVRRGVTLIMKYASIDVYLDLSISNILSILTAGSFRSQRVLAEAGGKQLSDSLTGQVGPRVLDSPATLLRHAPMRRRGHAHE